MKRIVIAVVLVLIATADLKVGATYVVPTFRSSGVAPTFRSAFQQQQKPAQKRTPRLFAPQDLGLLEPPDREAWQKPDQVMDALRIAEGMTVAEIGAGGGWFTIRLARRVAPNGRVYAVDVQRPMIEAIGRRIERESLTQIVIPVLGDDDDPKLPTGVGTDAVLIVDAFHEMANPVPMLKNVARTLQPHGRIGIIDYREGEGGPGPDAVERVPPSVVVSQAAAAGLKLVEQHTFLTYQYFLIFGK